MIHKNRCNRRYLRRKKIKRRLKILHEIDLWHDNIKIGKLSKGKIHCSCNLCSCKSTKLRRCQDKGFESYNCKDWYPARDKREFERIDYQDD